MPKINDTQRDSEAVDTDSCLSTDCLIYNDAISSVDRVSLRKNSIQPLDDDRGAPVDNANSPAYTASHSPRVNIDYLFHDDATFIHTESPPSYSSLRPRPRAGTQEDSLSITSSCNTDYGYPVLVKVKELRAGPFGCAGTMRKFTDAVMVSPTMTIEDLKKALMNNFATHPKPPAVASLMPLGPGDKTCMIVQTAWGYSGFLFRRSHRERVTAENWPRIASALVEQGFGCLKVKYWLEPAAEAAYRQQ